MARGVSSQESAMIGGAAHLVNFMGSDTVEGIWYANKYYSDPMAGFSIPALEHSVTTSWGRDREVDCFRNALAVYGKKGGLLACVSDSYDIFNAIENIWGVDLKQAVIDSGATIVIRPDSGDPVFVVCKCLRILSEKFGYTVNSKGYKVLNHVRLIQGDGININSLESILKAVEQNGFSVDNLAFGMGGGLLQQLDRDTQRFAMKASAIKVNGEWKGISKDPVTDPGKKSKSGRVIAVRNDKGEIATGYYGSELDIMEPIYTWATPGKTQTFREIRARANSYV